MVEVRLRGAVEAVVKDLVEIIVSDPGVDRDDVERRRPAAEARAAGICADRRPDGGNGKTARIEDDGVAPVHRTDGPAETGPAMAVRCRVEHAGDCKPRRKVFRSGLPDLSCNAPDRVPVNGLLVHHSNSLTVLA